MVQPSCRSTTSSSGSCRRRSPCCWRCHRRGRVAALEHPGLAGVKQSSVVGVAGDVARVAGQAVVVGHVTSSGVSPGFVTVPLTWISSPSSTAAGALLRHRDVRVQDVGRAAVCRSTDSSSGSAGGGHGVAGGVAAGACSCRRTPSESPGSSGRRSGDVSPVSPGRAAVARPPSLKRRVAGVRDGGRSLGSRRPRATRPVHSFTTAMAGWRMSVVQPACRLHDQLRGRRRWRSRCCWKGRLRARCSCRRTPSLAGVKQAVRVGVAGDVAQVAGQAVAHATSRRAACRRCW